MGAVTYLGALVVWSAQRRGTENSVAHIVGLRTILTEKVLIEIIRKTPPGKLPETLGKLLHGQRIEKEVLKEVLAKVDVVQIEALRLRAWRNRLVFSGTILFLMALALVLATPAQPSTEIRVSGEVRYAATNALVKNTRLRVPECEHDQPTGPDGRFAFPCPAERKNKVVHLLIGEGDDLWQADRKLEKPYRWLIDDVKIPGR